MYALLKQQAQATWGTGATVVAKAGLRLWLIAPEQDIDLGEVDPRSPFKIEQTDGGAVAVTVLTPIAEEDDVEAALTALRNESRLD